VRVDLAFWGGGSQTVPRPAPSALAASELLEIYAEDAPGLAILRLANPNPLAAPGSTVSLPVPPLSLSVGESQGTELEFVIMVIAVSCVKLLSAHNSTQHTSRKHKV